MNECQNCGESVDSRWKFCLNCGARMRSRDLPQQPVLPHTVPPTAVAVERSVPVTPASAPAQFQPSPLRQAQSQFQQTALPLQQVQTAQPYREVPSYLAERRYAPEPDYAQATDYDQRPASDQRPQTGQSPQTDQSSRTDQSPRTDYERAMDLDDSSAGGHVGRRKFRFDWQLALGVVLALGGIAMIVYLVVVLIVPHD